MRAVSFFKTASHGKTVSFVILAVRLTVGLAFILHGWHKIQAPLTWMGPESNIPGVMQFIAAFSEFGGGLALVVGLLFPLALLGLIMTMLGALHFHIVVMNDSFIGQSGGESYELVLAYIGISLLLLLLGPGSISLDSKLFGLKDRNCN